MTTQDTLRAAAERLTTDAYGHDIAGTNARNRDLEALADAYLATLDERPISPAVLLERGFAQEGDHGSVFRTAVAGRRVIIELDVMLTNVDEVQIGLESLPFGLWPQTASDLDAILSRLARG